MTTVPITFTVNVPAEAIIEGIRGKDKCANQALRDRAISQTVASFVVTVSFALIHVAVGALNVDVVEKDQPRYSLRSKEQTARHERGLEELIPGVIGTIISCVVLLPAIRAAMKPGSSENTHKTCLILSFTLNFLWCAWFAVICGVFSRQPDADIDALNLILAIINFIFMIFNLLSSCSIYRNNKTLDAACADQCTK